MHVYDIAGNVNNVSKTLKKKKRKDLNKRVMLDDITDLKHVTVIFFFQGVCVKCSFRSTSLAWTGETKQNERNNEQTGSLRLLSKNILESRLQPPLLGLGDAMKGCSSSVLPTGRPGGLCFFLFLAVVVVVVVV